MDGVHVVLESEDAMSEPLTDDELAAARALVDSATPGPWSRRWEPHGRYGGGDDWHIDSDAPGGGCVSCGLADGPEAEYPQSAADAAFIAASRTLVPRLLAEIDRLRKNTDTLSAVVATDSAARDNLRDQLVDKDAEIDRLRDRQQELLATIVRVTNETPYPDEVRGWESQRAAMLAEIGTLRAQLRARELTDAERETLRWTRMWLDGKDDGDTRQSIAKSLAVIDKLLGGGGK